MRKLEILMRVPNNVPQRRVMLSPDNWTRYQFAWDFGYQGRVAVLPAWRLSYAH